MLAYQLYLVSQKMNIIGGGGKGEEPASGGTYNIMNIITLRCIYIVVRNKVSRRKTSLDGFHTQHAA